MKVSESHDWIPYFCVDVMFQQGSQGESMLKSLAIFHNSQKRLKFVTLPIESKKDQQSSQGFKECLSSTVPISRHLWLCIIEQRTLTTGSRIASVGRLLQQYGSEAIGLPCKVEVKDCHLTQGSEIKSYCQTAFWTTKIHRHTHPHSV